MGVGIVRAVDMAQGCVYVLAPLDLGSMQKINVLQVCYLLPTGLYLAAGFVHDHSINRSNAILHLFNALK